MNKTGWIVLVIVVLVALGGAYAYAQKAKAPTPSMEPDTSAAMDSTATTTTTTTETSVDVSAPVSASAKTTTVAYTNQGFSPKSISINVGDTVHFVNQSSGQMWVASDAHPTHTEYDGTDLQEHCATGGSFDECKAVGAGGTFDFTFKKAGTFDLHNHVHASDTGVIVVK